MSEVAKFYNDPLGFVLFAFPWGEKGTSLENFLGPDKWQRDFLIDLGKEVRNRHFDGKTPVAPIRMAISKGHGVGGSVLAAMICIWIQSTRANSQGTVTANTFTQLSTKTWATLQHWFSMSLTAPWFNVSNEKISHRGLPKTWFCSAQTCKEENSEAFAGQHAISSTSFYIFDEGSAIPDKIFEVAEGGLTEGEPMIFLLGNPTRRTGKLYRVCFGEERERWNSRSIDSRNCAFGNKEQILEWANDWGENSDFFRVRVCGLPPLASELQFISAELVYAAQKREVASLPDEPLIAGIDLARGGGDWNVIRFRKGYDARTVPPVRIPGEETQNSMLMVTKILDVIQRHKPKAVFLDATGGSIGGPIGDRIRQLGFKVVDVQFGGRSPDTHYANMRAWMWSKMRDWLEKGAIDKSSLGEREHRLEIDLTGPAFGHDKRDRLILESKESMKARELHSPDDADALALTFAMPVMPEQKRARVPAYIGPWS